MEEKSFFLGDIWVGDTQLINQLVRNELTWVALFRRVQDCWDPGTGWKWELLEGILPSHIENTLATMLLRQNDEARDGMYENLTLDGNCSLQNLLSHWIVATYTCL